MFKVGNKKVIRTISRRSLRANRLRNIVAIIAITLTTMLFTTLFTIGLSTNEAFQQANFRQAGGYAHGTFKYLTKEQFDELKNDPLIETYGLRRFVGMPNKIPFNKAHVEIGYSDANQAKWMYLNPIQGTFPKEGSNEAATDTRVLSLLGVEPVIGTEFTITFNVDGKETTQTFILSGFWEYDQAIVASHVLVPNSKAEEIFKQLDTKGLDGMTARWNMDVMFKNSMNIENNIENILKSHGYQSENSGEENFVATGVNWGYTGAQFVNEFDLITMVGVIVILLLISFTGYLIIYNVFQISVASDIRFYGLLKTIGTTPKQLKRIVSKQAMALSVIGIPIGLFLGYFIGIGLTPVILSRLNGVVSTTISISPMIFWGSALFSLATVFISCRKPSKIAANVSPIEAVRYTESFNSKKFIRKNKKGVSLSQMALANLGRNKSKTVITILSLSLAIILLNLTFTFTNGFDMDKYLRNVVADFQISDASYFQVTQGWNSESVSEEFITEINKHGAIIDGGRVYGKTTQASEFVTEEYFRKVNNRYLTGENLDIYVQHQERIDDGRIVTRIQLYGMEDKLFSKLNVLDGDLTKLKDPSERYIAAVYFTDDYGNPKMDSNWAKLGDTVTIRYIDEMEYYNPDTGEVYEGDIPEGAIFDERILKYRDIDYKVCALVEIPHTMSYRYYGADEFIIDSDTFIKDTGTKDILYYAFDTTDESNAQMEAFLSETTQNIYTQFDYESKQTYKDEFENFRNMFIILGSVLSGIIGLVGILNFLNAVLTSIITRRKEFAMLESIGMTGKQLKSMLIYESLYYTLSSTLMCLALYVLAGPMVGSAIGNIFWFFSYKPTFTPILLCLPFMILISYIVPCLGYKDLVKKSVVERLREVD